MQKPAETCIDSSQFSSCYTGAVPFRHTVRIRYGECDMQGIVFNAHYLAYCDDAFGVWVEAVLPGGMTFVGNPGSFDVLVKKAVVTWHGALRFGETVDIDCSVDRWGRSSFDVRFRGSVDGTERFDVVVTYVNIAPGTHKPAPISADVRAALEN
jgi:acyl-CoA thioester hydrolase